MSSKYSSSNSCNRAVDTSGYCAINNSNNITSSNSNSNSNNNSSVNISNTIIDSRLLLIVVSLLSRCQDQQR